ncbi:MAG TPA: SDR family NAD(P)-dependent oxidoreductase [Acidimicrobiales bacterium]|nr:SDR family NAD(P)-dependent oxidoreductase [Acidimicrobiales bacterium]
MSVDHDVAVVTGGARGIGRSVALALGAAGHPVCVADTGVGLDGRGVDAGPASAVAAEIEAAGGRAMGWAHDARHPPAAAALVAAVGAWAGAPPLVLVHAAGTLRDAMVHTSCDDDWDEVLGSHLMVAVSLTRAMAGAIRAAGRGRIVYVGGAAGLVGNVGQSAYAVAKAGLFGLTRSVALELARGDVAVNYLVPFAYTRMTESIPPATDRLRDYLATAPQAGPDDVAPVVAWLCSDAAAGLTGQVLGARGAEIALWSQPRPAFRAVEDGGWGPEALTAARAAMEVHLVPLESEFDLLGGPPVAVRRTA